MKKINVLAGLMSLAFVLVISGGSAANADSFGSWGGSSGGSSGGFGSSGGGSSGFFAGRTPIRNLLGGIRDRFSNRFSRGSSGGSSGGFGSSGGSYMSSGGSHMIAFGGSSGGSSGGYGSSGVATGYYAGSMGSAGSTPVYSSYAPAFGTDTVNGSLYGVPTLYQGAPGTVIDPGYYSPAEGVPSPNDTSSPSESSPSPQPVNDGSTGLDARGPSLETVLKVRLPEESRFYVNGRPTTTEGAEREFVAKRLVPGQTYTFKVKAVLEKDGQTIERDQIVSLRGGDHHEIAFDFSEPRQAITSVAIHAPENAKIILAGTPANRGGETRVFSTRRLKSGETWEDYKVVAIIEKDGETITQEKSLTIVGGENHEINFDFENSDVRVASR